MTIDLTRDEIWFLQALRAAGERGRIVSAFACNAGLARLLEVQYVTKQPQSERKSLYVITHRGRQALENATSVEQLDERQHEYVAFTCRYPLKRGAASNGENCSRGHLWRKGNVNTYLQGREITATQNYERPSAEALHLIRKLRWIASPAFIPAGFSKAKSPPTYRFSRQPNSCT